MTTIRLLIVVPILSVMLALFSLGTKSSETDEVGSLDQAILVVCRVGPNLVPAI